jgi:hypothetical protein
VSKSGAVVRKADLLADKIVKAAAKGANGVAVVRKSTDSLSSAGGAGGDETDDTVSLSDVGASIEEEGGGEEGADDGNVSSDFSDEDDEDEFAPSDDPDNEGDECLHEREQELEAELKMATLRCNDLQETLQQLGVADIDEDDDEVEGDGVYLCDGGEDEGQGILEEEDEEDEEDEIPCRKPHEEAAAGAGGEKENETPRVANGRAGAAAAAAAADDLDKTPPRKNASGRKQLAPTPENGRGSIAVRVKFLRQRCVDVLGEKVFQQAYELIKGVDDGDLEQDDAELARLLGAERVDTFGGLIEQIVFMDSAA